MLRTWRLRRAYAQVMRRYAFRCQAERVAQEAAEAVARRPQPLSVERMSNR